MPDVLKILRKLPKNLLKQIQAKIDNLAKEPRPDGCKKLAGHENLYRVRVGDWRILYSIEDEKLIILILVIAPRGSAYRDF